MKGRGREATEQNGKEEIRDPSYRYASEEWWKWRCYNAVKEERKNVACSYNSERDQRGERIRLTCVRWTGTGDLHEASFSI